MSKKILWVSRHTMTQEQKDDLKRIFGDTDITQYDSTVSDVSEIVSAGKFDVYAVVLTAELTANLMRIIPEGAQVIQPVSERVFTGRTIINPATGTEENDYEYRHKCWRRVIRAIFETEEL